jgi:hypothetical protein
MNLTHDLSFLKDVSKNDRKLISGGATVSGSFTGTGSSSSSTASSSFSYSTSRDGVSRGSGRTARTITINGVVVKSEDKSFNIGPVNGPISFSFDSSVD